MTFWRTYRYENSMDVALCSVRRWPLTRVRPGLLRHPGVITRGHFDSLPAFWLALLHDGRAILYCLGRRECWPCLPSMFRATGYSFSGLLLPNYTLDEHFACSANAAWTTRRATTALPSSSCYYMAANNLPATFLHMLLPYLLAACAVFTSS